MIHQQRSHSTSKKLLVLVIGLCIVLPVAYVNASRHHEVLPISSSEVLPKISGAGVTDTKPLVSGTGFVANGERISPFDTSHAAIANLDPDVRKAVQDAANDALREGIEIGVRSGWRSQSYQRQLLDEAIAAYGTEEEANKWVSSPEKSMHVKGKALDVGPTDAMSWLSRYGSNYGLCQIYSNEPWHYELATIPGGMCPEQTPDSTANH